MSEISRISNAIPFEVNGNSPDSASMTGALVSWMTPSAHEIAPHWSRFRDHQLRALWRDVDVYKIAVNTFVNKAVTIPLRVNPVDRTIQSHVNLAVRMESDIRRNSGMFSGWKSEFKKFIVDYLTTDNGAFMMVMGHGAANQPLNGPALGVFHLDSALCTRTGNPEYPVVYVHSDGKRYALHYTRIIFLSNLPSPEFDLYGVGQCAISCALDAGVEMRDVYTYMQEKLGSRPKRQILYAETGTTTDQLLEAISFGEQKMDSEGLQRFSKTLLLGPKNASGTLKLNTIDLASIPDAFNRMDVSVINLSSVAAAFGLDVQDLSVAYGLSSAVSSTADVQERRGRGKGVGELLESVMEQIDEKILPDSLVSSFDNQDDAQDKEQADIWDTRSTARQRDLTTGSTTVSIERARMLRNGEITDSEYAEMELSDGRLPSGLDVLALFFSDDPDFVALLELPGVENPLIFDDNDAYTMIRQLQDLERVAMIRALKAQSANQVNKAKQALSALQRLRGQYEEQRDLMEQEAMMAEQALDDGVTEPVDEGDGVNANVAV